MPATPSPPKTVPEPGQPETAGRGSAGEPAGAALSPDAVPRRSPTPESPEPRSSGTAGADPGASKGTQKVTAYYVLLDDGGAGGVRFGCNDSLAAVERSTAGPAEPLAGAMRALLDGTTVPGLYNSLSTSTLTFLSGTFDGTTVTVYLSGTIRPGGACDIPRVEAQLTQTAVASVGAIRAEVYVNGSPLTEVLRRT